MDGTNIWLSECLPFDEDSIFPYDIIRRNILFEHTSFQWWSRQQMEGDLFNYLEIYIKVKVINIYL